MKVLWNGREGGRRGSRVEEISSAVPTSNSSEEEKPATELGSHSLLIGGYPFYRATSSGL